MGTVGTAQTLTWPNSCVYLSPKSTAAKVRLVSVVGVLIVHSDILQMQGLPSRSRGSGLTSVCGSPSGICSPSRQEGVKAVADWDTYSGHGGIRQPQLGLCEVPAAAETSKKLQQTGMRSLWWDSLPLPTEAGAGGWGRRLQWWACPLCTTQQWHLISKAVHASSRSIPGHAPHSHPLRLSLHSQQQSSPQIHSPNPTL